MNGKQIKILATFLVIAAVFVSGCVQQDTDDQTKIQRFSSESELEAFLEKNTGSAYGYLGSFGAATLESRTLDAAVTSQSAPEAGGSDDYSTTNIQVTGVDEADIVKNDGKYIYVLTGNKVVILDAYPAEDARILSEIEFDERPYEIFINDNKLVVFVSDYYRTTESVETVIAPDIDIIPVPNYRSGTSVNVYDVTDRETPVLERNASITGNYFDSRMIGDYIYMIVNDPVHYRSSVPVPLPIITTEQARMVPVSDIYYFNIPDSSYIYTTIAALNVKDSGEEINTKTFLMGYSNNIYVSMDNIYVSYTKRISVDNYFVRIVQDVMLPIVPLNVRNEINSAINSDKEGYEKYSEVSEIFQDYVESLGPESGATLMKNMEQRMDIVMTELAKETEKTVVHKIAVDDNNIEYKTVGEVPGQTLNQFSMDEYNDHFRIATTTGNWRATSLNHLYILDENMNIVGKVEDLAKGERIYSVRFMGDKAYMVTFRQVDPLFVIDVSNPNKPQVLGYLKIPGVSDYLHPYDENHIIGLGRDATEEGRITGMKLSLFDVTDVSNPVEMSKYIIGGRGTSSEALYDHKAFLFDKSKNLLVIPVREWSWGIMEDGSYENWQGAYVFSLDLETGFVLKGKITHIDETNVTEYRYDYNYQIRRSLYIDENLYTISNKMVKANNLQTLEEASAIVLPYETEYYYPVVR